MASIFSKIVAGEIPAHKIAETDEFLAFLDITPLVEGHTLVIPKKEIDYVFEIDDDILGRMMVFAKHVAKSIEKAIPCKRIGVAVIGLEVPHAHIHLVPLNQMNDINFSRPKLQVSQEQLAATAEKIKGNQVF
ncbi:HIT family protein [Solitalea koreensis]|uniref:Histidine triad (HIT) family protein n=1 Tax=Solitalea koreensis TaxID=543615 RepID=A0A521AQH3_9SPHI|nr:HIT family protein [Solitalea koreensis]SMO37048.1 histidine triad (HIT) family protein [Solitalea koreensis]